jgi:hypothetical protein
MIAEKNKSFSEGSVFVNARARFDGAPPLPRLVVSTLIISMLMVSTHLVSTLTIPTLTILELVISTLTIAWALGPGAWALERGAICAPPAAPHFVGGHWGLWLDCSRQHCERSPRQPPIWSGAMGGYCQTETPDSASIAPGCPPQCPA